MLDIAGSEERAYSQKWLKKKFEDMYSDYIVFVRSLGNATMVCLQNIANCLVTEKCYYQGMSDAKDEAKRIIKTKAKLTVENIRSVRFQNEFYLSRESMGDVIANIRWLSAYLRVIMS